LSRARILASAKRVALGDSEGNLSHPTSPVTFPEGAHVPAAGDVTVARAVRCETSGPQPCVTPGPVVQPSVPISSLSLFRVLSPSIPLSRLASPTPPLLPYPSPPRAAGSLRLPALTPPSLSFPHSSCDRKPPLCGLPPFFWHTAAGSCAQAGDPTAHLRLQTAAARTDLFVRARAHGVAVAASPPSSLSAAG
jgi:hypothetical protein